MEKFYNINKLPPARLVGRDPEGGILPFLEGVLNAPVLGEKQGSGYLRKQGGVASLEEDSSDDVALCAY